MAKATTAAKAAASETFQKESILASAKYANRRDALSVLLEDNKDYTLEEVDTILENFMKGKVN